jgi:PMC2NT (NUC016) domain
MANLTDLQMRRKLIHLFLQIISCQSRHDFARDPSMDPKTYPEWQGKLLKLLVATTKAASSVGSHDVSFERSINSQFNSSIDNVLDRMLSLSNRLLKFGGLREEEFEDEEDLENRWTQVVDVLDGLLERAARFFLLSSLISRILVSTSFLGLPPRARTLPLW